MGEQIEKRRHVRVELEGYIADVADGYFVYACSISPGGKGSPAAGYYILEALL